MIEVCNLGVVLGSFALRDVSFKLPEGGCLAVLGPSGAGKTVLLEAVMGAVRPRHGCVLLGGRDITALAPEHRRIAYIPQDLALFPHLSVRRNILFGLPHRAVRRGTSPELVQLAQLLEIEHLLDRRHVGTLSGGEKQRVALARALIVQPRVLFLDEPFASLDGATRSNLLRVFRAVRRKLNTTVLFVTHDLDEACLLADDVVILMDGHVVESGPSDRVLRQPHTVAVARFLNIRNVFPITWLPALARDRSLKSVNGSTHWAIRAEDVELLGPADKLAYGLPARLEDLIPLGSHAIAELVAGAEFRLEAAVTHDQVAALTGQLGRDIWVRLAPDRILLLVERDGPPSGYQSRNSL